MYYIFVLSHIYLPLLSLVISFSIFHLHKYKARECLASSEVSFCFPIFTDKTFVFDSEISLSIYDQAFYEDMKEFDEEALNFDTGETIEYWIEQYWKSMITLKDYLRKRTYPKPEVLIFEPVPKEIISFCEER